MKKRAYEKLVIQVEIEFKVKDHIQHPIILIELIKMLKSYKPTVTAKSEVKVKLVRQPKLRP